MSKWPWKSAEYREDFEKRCEMLRCRQGKPVKVTHKRGRPKSPAWLKAENKRFQNRMRFDQAKVWTDSRERRTNATTSVSSNE